MNFNNNSHIMVLNGGSSSLKFSLFHCLSQTCVGRGAITGIGTKPVFSAKGKIFEGSSHPLPELTTTNCHSPSDGARELMKWLENFLPKDGIIAVGHRVVHGRDIEKHSIVEPHLMAYLRTLIPLAPLHQPFNLEVIDILMNLYPKVPQVACFDTAYHQTIADIHTRYAIPRVWHEKGVRRYGYHGLSYEYIAGRLPDVSPRAAKGKTLVAHLGNGASMCAMDEGRSFATTMGFSVLEGLIMGTRPGNLDPGIILYFMREAKLDEPAIARMLYHDSGLRGVSGISNDMAVLLGSKEPEARQAVDLFCLRITREAGGLISLLGGLDTLVFTGGIGENASPVRQQVLESLSWLGIKIDAQLNANLPKGEVKISTPDSAIDVWVIPTDEELVIARHTMRSIEEEAARHARNSQTIQSQIPDPVR